jgi:hypothetical protein
MARKGQRGWVLKTLTVATGQRRPRHLSQWERSSRAAPGREMAFECGLGGLNLAPSGGDGPQGPEGVGLKDPHRRDRLAPAAPPLPVGEEFKNRNRRREEFKSRTRQGEAFQSG